jgi:hypothetical protein
MKNVIQKPSAPRLTHKRKWEAKRDAAIKRLVAADEDDDTIGVLDTIALAHIAAVFEWDGEFPKRSGGNKGVKRLIAAWEMYDRHEPQKLRAALDDFTFAHATEAFEVSGVPLNRMLRTRQ